MDVNSLRYFLSVARNENITYAASELRLSQPALSKQIRTMEDELGVKLFNRKTYGVELTKAGEVLRERAQEIVDLMNKTISDIRLQNKELSGDLRIMIVSNGMASRFARATGVFAANNPNVRVNVYNGGLGVARDMLKRGQIDMALMFRSAFTNDFDCLDLNIHRPLGLIMRASDDLSSCNYVSMTKLAELSLIGPVEGMEFGLLKNLPMDYNSLKIVATFDDPADYVEILRYTGYYLLCVQPSLSINEDYGLIFRPLEPRVEADVCLARLDNSDGNELIDSFFQHICTYMDLPSTSNGLKL